MTQRTLNEQNKGTRTKADRNLASDLSVVLRILWFKHISFSQMPAKPQYFLQPHKMNKKWYIYRREIGVPNFGGGGERMKSDNNWAHGFEFWILSSFRGDTIFLKFQLILEEERGDGRLGLIQLSLRCYVASSRAGEDETSLLLLLRLYYG